VRNDTDFGMIWIGHPWIFYLKKEDDILLTGLIEKNFHKKEWKFYHANENNDLITFDYSEDRNKNSVMPSDFKYSISKSAFEQALVELEQTIQNLKKRTSMLVEQLGIENSKMIAQCLFDGNGSLLSYDKEDNEMVFEEL